ncbi:Serine/threonine-protein kinase ATR [Lucilia cuprina]|uniref:Serine/threonine-protein kinase ATR n=1 Tax=Lucilia cuprina TaxID=7375 RepID=A0A0L0C880_LUCCU|nr:Serine/threonine-protein kinase ATR [Lucilia cuprina]
MTDRRKDMWKLLYSLVNRNETELNDVFVFVDDILCKEPSLIRYSVKESTNRFQDTFILWLVNKLVKSLKVESDQDYEIHEKNLKVQRKLLNSCLINRGVLFETLIKAYISAIEQLCEEYSKVDLSCQEEVESQLLKIIAFTSSDDCLKEIDPNFSFPLIEVDIDDVDDYVQALLQVLHHGLFVGYTNYSLTFEGSLMTVLKALKECEFSTKLYCLQYLGRVFQKVPVLNNNLQHLYELSLRALTMMWNYMPIWLNNNCFALDCIDEFVEESSSFLKILKNLQHQVEHKDVLIRHCFLLMEYIYEIHQWLRYRTGQNYQNLLEVFKTLVELLFQLINSSTIVKDQQGKFFNLFWRVVEDYPIVLRLLPAYLHNNKENTKLDKYFKFIEVKVLDFVKLDKWNNSQFEVVQECLNSLKLWEHLYQHQQQIMEAKSVSSVNEITLQNKPASNCIKIEKWIKPLDLWCTKVNNSNRVLPNERDEIIISAFLLQSNIIVTQLPSQIQAKLLEIVLKPIKNTNPMKILQNDSGNLELSLDMLTLINNLKSENANSNIKQSLKSVGKQIFSSNKEHDNLILKFSSCLNNFMAKQWLSMEYIMKEFLVTNLKNKDVYNNLLKLLSCFNAETKEIMLIKKFPYSANICAVSCAKLLESEVLCVNCFNASLLQSSQNLKEYLEKEFNVLCVNKTVSSTLSANQKLPADMKLLLIQQLFLNEELNLLNNHLTYCNITSDECLKSIFSLTDMTKIYLPTVSSVLANFIRNEPEFIHQLSAAVLQKVIKSLNPDQTYQHQKIILEIISCCTQSGLLTEHWLFHFFKMTFFYLLHPESKVVHEAILTGCEMCSAYNVQPIQLWNWYKRDALNLIVKLMIYVYLTKGVRMTRSLKAFTKMLGFSCVQEFICKYYRLLVTMILPYCVKAPLCKGLIVSISKITRKPVTNLFVVSFLRIYTHIYLTEDSEIGNACIEFIGKCTGASLSKLMNTDVKQTVSEFLVYFNRSPTFVMQAFQCLLPNEVGASTSMAMKKSFKSSTHEFASFITDRFLGVITYFQTCLSEPNFEKPLKEETLYSLGQIMRLIGSNNVTQFRFKIIAMLSFVLTLNDRNLQNICLKIWNIFLHIVNTQELGPSLSRIVASLQPLMSTNAQEVNDIYDYLIMKNDSLLGVYIPDLYFLEDMPEVKPNIRQYVARQTEILNIERNGVADKLGFLYKQVCNENLQVRIYGLNYMRSFIAKYRSEINNMILDTVPVDPLIEQIVDELMKGCRHDDRNMNLASAKCLGELGAIDPSYMSANFSFMNSAEISLSIHTDDFAIMALMELCKAYQFQKDTKYVDNFSLAIQETLSVFGVSPKENKKLNVWDALPTRMQQVMEPLLNSCYTGSRRESKLTEHPLFESSLCRSYEDWSFAWACRLIEMVQSDETKHLLNSYKPSIKRDTNMLGIFFPYILLHALQECPQDKVQQIFEEFMAVFNFCSRDNTTQQEMEVSGYREFKSSKYAADKMPSESSNSEQFETSETLTQTCTKLCSEQVDFLQRWCREWQKVNMVGGKLTQTDDRFKNIYDFIKKFNKALISKANYNSGEYARALMYLEEYIEEQPSVRLQEQLSFLIEIHGKLMDSDSVEGAVYMKKSNLSLEEEILVNRLIDKPEETITCYEQLLSKDDHQINQDHIKGMIDCYLRMDNPETALLITDGLWQKLADQYTDDYFKECKSELLWRLGRYDELQELLEDSVVKRKTTNWNIQCAESFLLFRQPNDTQLQTFENFLEQLDVIRSNVVSSMRSCSVVTGNSYTHSYDEVIRLHLLNELENNKQLINQITKYKNHNNTDRRHETKNTDEMCLKEVQEFFNNWDARLEVLQPIARVLEPVFCFRRNLLLETQRILQQDLPCANNLIQKVNDKINDYLVKLWLRTIHMNREAGCLQQAQISIMKAEQYQPVTLFLEKAKLLWQKGHQSNCFKLLEENIKVLENKCEGDIRKLDTASRHLYAETKFLQASYNAESMNICSELNLRYFKEAVAGNRTCEKYLVHYSQYMEKIYDSFTREQKESENGCRLLLDIMLHYAKSLKYGYANVYQSLPRLLSIWLDFTSQLVSMTESNQTSDSSQVVKISLFQELAKKMNDMINNCVNMLPTSIFYTAFSQLLSRICHPSPDVFNNLRNIFIKLIEHFPQQSLWMLLPIFKSCHNSRIKRCRLIFTDARLNKPAFQKLLNDFNMLAERLIELTDKEVTFDRTYELSGLVRQLPRLFEDSNFSKIMLPFEKFMQPSFPITSTAESLNLNASISPDTTVNASSVPSNPFPSCCVYLCGISEEVVVLRSAAKPKKITIECSDGISYNVMVKPKDDLRKDFRLMEFNGLVKRFLHQDSKARHRRLRIRTYAAIPFNEECGLVEWLPNLNSFRGICVSMYRMRGLGIPDRALRQCALPKTDPIEKKRAMFTDVLLTRHPPIFHEWFKQRFPSPHSWYQARSSYVKTIAVMSMVGYILGLGDRHGENILFDETNGDAVHVDFNCLFNQGESFAYPEIVPFRLTHNMVFAMGPLGVEGLFRKCCEITLRLLKDESKTLMSVLRPFVYDLGAINRLKGKTTSGLEITDPKAITDVKRIEERLQGYVKRTLGNSMPLSTEGQVNFLINEATDIDNLASMYIGWGSYI